MHWTLSPRRVLVLVTALLLLAAAAAWIVTDQRTTRAEQAASEHVAAEHELGRDVEQRRRAMAAHAQEARTASEELRRGLAAAVRGSERGAVEVAREAKEQLRRLRTTADELAAVAEQPRPAKPDALPVSEAEPVLDRLASVDDQALWVADHLHETADEAKRLLSAATRLGATAERFASHDLPSTDDPDELAARWRAEAEELDEYRETAEVAAQQPGLEAVGAAHLQLVDGLAELASDAIALLDDGDVDAYNELLADRLGGDDPFGFHAALEESLEEVTSDGALREATDAQRRSLGLLAELDKLREADPLRSTSA